MGFMQMGFGLAGGAAGALIGDPVVAMATVIPAFGLISIVSWTIWRGLDEPASASVVAPQALAPEPGE
jgi:DHA1 family bicyclomycin/chloramphenicol resistance-like MFS transporter